MGLFSRAAGALLDGVFQKLPFNSRNAVFNWLTETDKRLTRLLRRTVHDARNRRLTIPDGLTIRRTKAFVPALHDNLARVDVDDGCILVCSRNTARFSDKDIRVLLGHELGHLIYDSIKCQRAQFVRDISEMGEEDFCDAISAFITSPEMFRETSKTREMGCSLETNYALTRYLEKPARRKARGPRR